MNKDPQLSGRQWLAQVAGAVLAATALVACAPETGAEHPPTPLPTTSATAVATPAETTGYAPEPVNPLRLTSYNEVARGLGMLERTADQQLFSGAMEFLSLPQSAAGFAEATDWHAAALQELDDAKLAPLTVLEPEEGRKFSEISTANVARYFALLQAAGIRDAQLGRVVVCPEYVAGNFSRSGDNYARDVNRFTQELHSVFPKAHATLLIDTWRQETNTVLPQARAVKQSSIDSVGIQAYANSAVIPFDDQGRADVSSFLSTAHIAQIAKAFPGKPLWISTGIPRSDEALNVTYSPKQRAAIARAIVQAIADAQAAGHTIDMVNLFIEDKSAGDEGDAGRDFSFSADEAVTILPNLAEDLQRNGVALSGFAVQPEAE